MAITEEISWGDGSGDKIYLTANAFEGDQTVLVSSDANTGSSDRTKSITFTASHHGTSSVKVLTITQEGVPEQYIIFADSTVEQICATTWGDGTGIKPSQAAVPTNMSTQFAGNANITSFDEFVYFTNVKTITTIVTAQVRGFKNCTSLEYIALPPVTFSTGDNMFSGCTSLKRITISDQTKLASGTTAATTRAFENCSNLTRIDIPNIKSWLEFTKNFTFNNFDIYQTVPFYKSGEGHLYMNGEEVLDVVIPDTYTSIPALSFSYCKGIRSITIPSTVTSIGNYAFASCSGLTGPVPHLQNLTSISAGTFSSCSGFTSLTIPSNITSIGNNAFQYCSGIVENHLVIPSSVTSIGVYAFRNCTGISSITVPSSITTININAFAMCGDCNGILTVNGDATRANSGASPELRFKKVIITGNFSSAYMLAIQSSRYIEDIRIGGSITFTSSNIGALLYGGSGANNCKIQFVELMGTSNAPLFYDNNYTLRPDGTIVHLGYDTVTNSALPCTATQAGANRARVTKIYVGKGQSASEDNAILAMYTTDSGWSTYSSKLDTWYNYVNSPSANSDFIN